MRLPYFLLGLAVGLFLAFLFPQAFAATNPDAEPPAIRLQKPAKSKSQCILKTTTQRFMISPDGEYQYAGGFTMWTACDR